MPDDHAYKTMEAADQRPPSLSVDWQLYAEYLADTDLSDHEKREFIEAIWYIVLSFVDMGFGVAGTLGRDEDGQDDEALSAVLHRSMIEAQIGEADSRSRIEHKKT